MLEPTPSRPDMARDIRETEQFEAIAEFYSALYAPGTEHVYAPREFHPAPDGRVYLIGATFADELEAGPSTNAYCLQTGEDRMTVLLEGGEHMAISQDGLQAAVFGGGVVHILDLAGGGAIAQLAVDGIVEHLAWSVSGQLGLLIAGASADVAGAQGGFALRVEQDGPAWLPAVDTGGAEDVWRRLWVWEGKGEHLRMLTVPPLNVWEFEWLSDANIAAICSDHHGEGSWYTATLRRVDGETGLASTLHVPGNQIGKPKVSAEDTIAFLEAVCSDRGIVAGTVCLFQDGATRKLQMDAVDVTDMHWQSADKLAFAGLRGLKTVIGTYDVATDETTIIWAHTDRTCGDLHPAIAVTANEIFATVESYAVAPELQRIDGEGATTLWSFAAPGPSPVRGAVETTRWTAPDGTEIEGLLIRPEGEAQGLPLLVDIHGGPVWSYRNRWAPGYRAAGPLVACGFAVLLPNPRGSSGRGQDFASQIIRDMGGADTHDFISGIDHLAASGLVDRDKVVVTGTSYGGFMSCWLITQHTRIAAAIPISPVSNWYSQHFTSQIPSFDEISVQGSPYSPVGQYFDRSPVFQARTVRTPALILAGGRDKNTPPTQALEFHNALLHNDVDSVLCTYPEAGHSVRSYPSYLDSAARVMIWAQHYAGTKDRTGRHLSFGNDGGSTVREAQDK